MTCSETVRRLMDYVDNRLPPTERRSLEAHLIDCPRCVEFLQSYRVTPQIVRRSTQLVLSRAAARRLQAIIKHVLKP
jgi:anti-sigma factor RsiW